MKDFVEYLVKNIVSTPDSVSVSCEDNGDQLNIQIDVDEKDRARVIGREGKTIRALRTIVIGAASRLGHKVFVELKG